MATGYRTGQKAMFPATVPTWPCAPSLFSAGTHRSRSAAALSQVGALGPDLACVPAGIEFVVTQLKSMVLTLGLIDLRLTVEQAVLLSRLEEEYQVRGASRPRLTPPPIQTNWGGG